MQNDVVLTMRGICKSFPGTRALHNVDFTLRKGEIHALMGENGAGKSTLIKVLTGVYEKDSGSITVDGSDAHIRSPQDAQDYVWAVQENYPQYDKFNFCCNYDSNGYLIEKITFTYNKTKASRAAKLKAKIDSITRYARKKGSYWKQVEYVNWRMKKMCAYDWSAYYSSDYRKYEIRLLF